MEGQIKFFNVEKHWGIIETEAGDFFYHGSNVIGPLPEKGDVCDFVAVDGRRPGELQASHVTLKSRGRA